MLATVFVGGATGFSARRTAFLPGGGQPGDDLAGLAVGALRQVVAEDALGLRDDLLGGLGGLQHRQRLAGPHPLALLGDPLHQHVLGVVVVELGHAYVGHARASRTASRMVVSWIRTSRSR